MLTPVPVELGPDPPAGAVEGPLELVPPPVLGGGGGGGGGGALATVVGVTLTALTVVVVAGAVATEVVTGGVGFAVDRWETVRRLAATLRFGAAGTAVTAPTLIAEPADGAGGASRGWTAGLVSAPAANAISKATTATGAINGRCRRDMRIAYGYPGAA